MGLGGESVCVGWREKRVKRVKLARRTDNGVKQRDGQHEKEELERDRLIDRNSWMEVIHRETMSESRKEKGQGLVRR